MLNLSWTITHGFGSEYLEDATLSYRNEKSLLFCYLCYFLDKV